jgi:hypothetical protein
VTTQAPPLHESRDTFGGKMFISRLKKMLHFFEEVVLHPPDVTMLSAYFRGLPLHFTSTTEPVKERFSSNLHTLEPSEDTLIKC